jgi:hypothetical protein
MKKKTARKSRELRKVLVLEKELEQDKHASKYLVGHSSLGLGLGRVRCFVQLGCCVASDGVR